MDLAYGLSWTLALLPVFAACVWAADFPSIPSDKTTPVQQRLAINGANGEWA